MNIILSDHNQNKKFLPLTYTRSIADFRIGILTIREKWENFLQVEVGIVTEDYLQAKYQYTLESDSIIVLANIIPDAKLVSAVLKLQNQALYKDGQIIAFNNTYKKLYQIPDKRIEYPDDLMIIKNNSDIFSLNNVCLEADFVLLTAGRKSAELSKTNRVFGKNSVFVEEGAWVECSTINTDNGSVYIGRNSKIMEGSNIRGPFALCDNSEIKMGAKIYGATTIGPWCKVGGEINNSVFFAFSSKAHDGFLGNSVIGEWCNLGADTNNSNLKNNYAIVKLWDYLEERFLSTNLQFCGLIMGDHSKSAINTMFNTGTVVGVSANIFGAGFPRNFIPSFSWGGASGLKEYKLNSVFNVMSIVMQRRNVELSDIDKSIFEHIFSITSKYRNF